jgi:hypothetical protein
MQCSRFITQFGIWPQEASDAGGKDSGAGWASQVGAARTGLGLEQKRSANYSVRNGRDK